MSRHLTINCDLGEGMENEEQLLDYIDKASIACGGHFGDKNSILHSLRLAQSKNVACGIHPSYPDKDNFGRKPVQIPLPKLKDSLCFQLELFLESSQKLSIEIDHVKAHGALYNVLMEDLFQAEILLKSMEKLGVKCPVFALYGSTFHKMYADHFPLLIEGFIDRKYTNQLRLASRAIGGALITEPIKATQQFKAFKENSDFETIDGKWIKIDIDTACIHGDNPAALTILQSIKEAELC